jgi:dihydrofolate reductase
MKASVYIATSLDGFIAREDGALDWLPQPGEGSGDEDYGYDAFMATVDVIVMGRKSFEKVLTFGAWPYVKPVVVLSSGTVKIPEALKGSVELMSGSPAEIVASLSGRGVAHAYVDGGATIQNFIAAGLIQRLTITRIPVLIGRGIPLFGTVLRDVPLRHIQTRSYSSGMVQSEYAVAGTDDGL